MGGLWSSSSKAVDQQLSYASNSLSHHKDCIEGLVKAMESTNVQYGLYLQTKHNQVPDVDIKALVYANKEGSSVDGNQRGQINPFEGNIMTLVKASQSALQCHVRVVQTSFCTLEEIINDSIRRLSSGNRTDSESESVVRSHIDKISNLTLRITCLEKENKEMREQHSTDTMEIENLIKKIEDCTEQITSLERRNVELELKGASLKKDLEDRENKISVPVQLFYQTRGDTMSKVTNELKTLLVQKLELERSKIQFIDCQSKDDVNPEIPLFILCINTSRLGTDAESALQKLKGCVSSKVSILIFHHKDVHALPSQSSERVLTGPIFNGIGGIFDLAFLSEKGLYPCELNDTAATGIVTFLNKNR